MSTIASHSLLNISETVRDRGLVSNDYTNKKWPTGNRSREGQVVTPIRLESNIATTAGDGIQQQSLITR